MSQLTEHRVKQDPIPTPLEDFITTLQKMTIHKMEQFGWHLWFIRRPLFQEKTVILNHNETSDTMQIDEEGISNRNHTIQFRK